MFGVVDVAVVTLKLGLGEDRNPENMEGLRTLCDGVQEAEEGVGAGVVGESKENILDERDVERVCEFLLDGDSGE